MLTTMIFAKDHGAMAAFYQRGFELRVDAAASSEGYTVLVDDASRLSIHAIPPDLAESITIAEPPETRSEGAVKLLFEVADLAPTCDRLVSLGGQLFATTTDDAFDGCDVEGNVFRVSSVP
jgi:hypothetical protein